MDVRSDRLVRVALRVWIAIGAVLLLAVAYWLFRDPLALIGPPVAIAIVIIYLLHPGVSWLERHRVVRPLGTLVAYVVMFGLLFLALSQLGPVLAEQVRGLLDELPDIGQSLQTTVNAQLEAFGVPPSSRLDLQPEALTEELRAYLTTNEEQVLGLIRGAGSIVSWVVHVGLALVLGPILAFYALADLPRLGAGVRRLLPPDRRPEVVEVIARIGSIVGAYFRGQLLVATFVGAATAAGLAAIGLPFWAVVGVTTGVFNLIPLVGPTAGAVFGVLLALTVGTGVQQAVLVVVVMVVVQQVDNHVITPTIVSRSVAVHPITVILALVVAGALGGIPMMFIAIPLVAVIKLVVLHVVVTRVPSMSHVAEPEGGDGSARSRRGTVGHLAQELRRSFERRLGDVAGRGAGDADDEVVRPDRSGGAGPDDQVDGTRSAAGDAAAASDEERGVSPPAEVAPPT